MPITDREWKQIITAFNQINELDIKEIGNIMDMVSDPRKIRLKSVIEILETFREENEDNKKSL